MVESRAVPPPKGKRPGWALLLRLLLGRIGRTEARSIAKSYLLDASELPGDSWTPSREANFHSIRFPFQRTPHLSRVVASRNYRQGLGARSLYIELAVLDSAPDIERLLADVRSRPYYKRPGVTLMALRVMSGYDLPEVQDLRLTERDTRRRTTKYVFRAITGRVGDVFISLLAQGSPGGWKWDEVMEFATIQANKIRRLRSSASTAAPDGEHADGS